MGLVPDTYDIENIRFDLFHGLANVVKLMLTYICKMLRGNYSEVDAFVHYLGTMTYWNDFQISQWLAVKPLTRLKGKKLRHWLWVIT